MLFKYLLLTFQLSCLQIFSVGAQQKIVRFEPGEKWFGGAVNDGQLMPFKDGYSYNMYANTHGNQAAPLLLSSKGRYVWSDEPFAFSFSAENLTIVSPNDIEVTKAGSNLREAYRAAAKKYFPPSGKMPDSLLFTRPQYNTWIELVYNQNQQDILKYAHDIINNGFPPGVLMIDDNWAPYYGRFEFRKDRFPDARKMMEELHGLGFKVMIWVCPFIRPDSEEFRELLSKKLLLMDSGGDSSASWQSATEPAIIRWWNGYSAVMDFTNPGAIEWFDRQLTNMISTYGLDGFKFDAGDPEYYPANSVSYKKVSPNTQTELYGSFGLKYPLNEYRAMWKMGGQPIAERLRDKEHSWTDMQKLVPGMTAAGLLGYMFACPDMIGGGEFGSFIGKDHLDQDLVVRSAQCHALMPMMQFSVAPWRVLEEAHFAAVKKSVSTRQQFVPLIMKLVQESLSSGEPVVRNMEYVFPQQGLDTCLSQFMLGDSLMVAPVTTPGNTRQVRFPKGRWKGDDGSVIKGPAVKTITANIDRLPYYRLIK